MLKLVQRALTCQRGSVAIVFAAAVVPLLIAAGMAVQFAVILGNKAELQSRLDALALGAAKIFVDNIDLRYSKRGRLIDRYLAAHLKALSEEPNELASFDYSFNVDLRDLTVTIDGEVTQDSGIMSLIGIDVLHSSLVSKAVANIYRKPVCILSLSHKVGVGIEFSGDGEMKAKDCVVWSNARGVEALRFDGSGKVRSERLCAVGRAGSVGQFSVDPKPQSHCPPVADPLSSWVAPTVGLCTHTSLPDEWITGTTANLQPGVYCGGLRVDANKIKLHKGIYIIKDGPLILRGSSEISGKDVGIFLTGLDSYLDIDGRSEVDIRAASKGVMAGIAIAARGDVGDSKITGRSDLKIGGVIYLPNQNLSYQGESEIVAISPITTIIANSIKLGGEAYLEVANDRDKAIYAPIIETGGVVYLSE